MADPISQAVQIAGNTARFGWYYGINWLMDRQASRLGAARPSYKPSRPVPTKQQILTDLAQLFIADAAAVSQGLYPAGTDEPGSIGDHFARLRLMMADMPGVLGSSAKWALSAGAPEQIAARAWTMAQQPEARKAMAEQWQTSDPVP